MLPIPFSLPNDMSPGIYTLSIAVVGEEDTEAGRATWHRGPIRRWLVSVEQSDDIPVSLRAFAQPSGSAAKTTDHPRSFATRRSTTCWSSSSGSSG